MVVLTKLTTDFVLIEVISLFQIFTGKMLDEAIFMIDIKYTNKPLLISQVL